MSLDIEEAPPAVKAVELHIDTKVIDHPVVPIRWCISPETIKHMREHPERDWALIIVAQQPAVRDEAAGYINDGDRTLETRVIVEGMRNISVNHGFFQFRAAGKFHMVAYLVSSSWSDDHHPKKTAFWRAVRDYGKMNRNGYSYEDRINLLNPDDTVDNLRQNMETYATDFIQVTVPPGIFAKEMKPWLRKYLDYIGLGVGRDECAGRWRLLLAFTIFPIMVGILIALVFVLNRVWYTILGFLHLLVGGNPLVPWKPMFTWDVIPDAHTHPFMPWDFKRLPLFSGIGLLFIPLPLLLIGGIVAIMGARGSVIGAGIVLAAAAAGYVYFLWAGLNEDKVEEAARRSAETRRQREISKNAALLERYAVCGAEPAEGPRTIELFWSGIKREVCKPRARG